MIKAKVEKKAKGEVKGTKDKEKDKEPKKTAMFRRHFRGSLSMVLKGGENDTSRSEFEISLKPRWEVDLQIDTDGNAIRGTTIVFGRVVEGFDVLTKLSKNNDPDSPDRIETAEVIRPAKHPRKLIKILDKPETKASDDAKAGEKTSKKSGKDAPK